MLDTYVTANIFIYLKEIIAKQLDSASVVEKKTNNIMSYIKVPSGRISQMKCKLLQKLKESFAFSTRNIKEKSF